MYLSCIYHRIPLCMFLMGRGFIGYPKGRNRDIKLVNLPCLRTRHINMFKNEEYSSFLNIFTKKTKFTILLIYKFYIPISTFRVSYKATIIFNVLVVIDKIKRRSQLESSNFCPELRNPPIIF